MNGIEINKTIELQKLLVPNRIKILGLLYKEDTCVCQMVEKLDLKHNLISHHLKTLCNLNYITSTRNGQHIIYSLCEPKKETVRKLLDLIENLDL